MSLRYLTIFFALFIAPLSFAPLKSDQRGGHFSGERKANWSDIFVAKQNQKEDQKGEALSLLLQLPDWNMIRTIDNKKKYYTIASTMYGFNSEMIKKAVAEYFKLAEGDTPEQCGRMVKIFIFNRLFFKVPSKPVPYKEIFGGFGTHPRATTDYRKINWLIPLSENSKGDIDLTGGFTLIRCVYRPVDEFEYFEKTFGRRKLRLDVVKDKQQ